MRKFLFIVIIFLSLILRFYSINTAPSGLNADEAALGYNAYSILLTGHDEHGHAWPVNLESFGDFKPALYAYILIPFIKLFGLSTFAVRLPSVIFGVLSVVLIYFLTQRIFPNRLNLPLISSLVLAISPWAIHYSRGGWETNLANSLLLSGALLFVSWIDSPSYKKLSLSFICFVLTLYAYQSTRVVTPLFVFGLILIYRKALFFQFRKVAVASIVPSLMLIPLVLSLLGSGVSSRLSGVGLLADIGPLNRVNVLRGEHSAADYSLGKVLHNRPVIYTLQFFKNYFDHFSPKFLFISGDEVQRNRVPETGLLYLTDFIFIALGLAVLWRRPTTHSSIIWLWLLVAPVASAMTFQTPSALRASSLLVPLCLLVSLGVDKLFNKIFHLKTVFISSIMVISLLYIYQVSRYLHEYYVHYPRQYPAAWEYGFSELVPYIQSLDKNYNQILITDKYDQPYILFLFFLKYPPEQFQNHHVLTFRDKFNFSTVRDFDKYHFASTSWDKVRDIHNSLIVAAPEDIPSAGVNVIKTIYFPNGQAAFKIISN